MLIYSKIVCCILILLMNKFSLPPQNLDVFEWSMARFVAKKEHHKDMCDNEFGPCAQMMNNVQNSIMGIIRRTFLLLV